ncbi:hypothetical protein ACIA5A_29080 [Micromonospora sp. NPDC051300]|uniref:hypothetical protein n=1 Tax=Micromonospora sp. NPDC051300 TaxID=3364286 RepID=UPI0037AD4697
MSTTAHDNVQDINRQMVRDLVADLASRITSQTAHDSASVSRQRIHLRQLAALMVIRAAADELANATASEAARCGANYPAIGEAAGMTRQAARVRWPGLVDRKRMIRRPGMDTAEASKSTARKEKS